MNELLGVGSVDRLGHPGEKWKIIKVKLIVHLGVIS